MCGCMNLNFAWLTHEIRLKVADIWFRTCLITSNAILKNGLALFYLRVNKTVTQNYGIVRNLWWEYGLAN